MNNIELSFDSDSSNEVYNINNINNRINIVNNSRNSTPSRGVLDLCIINRLQEELTLLI